MISYIATPQYLLEHLLSALFLGGKAGNSPHFDLNAIIELLPPHVPHSLVGGSYGTILWRGGTEERKFKPNQVRFTAKLYKLLHLKINK